MKFIITEDRFNEIIFNYLDNKNFIKVDKGENIYFLNSEKDEYAQIKYNKNNEVCYIYYKLVDEISSLFSMELIDSEKVIGKWVESTLQMKVSYTISVGFSRQIIVESTLQIIQNIRYLLS